VEGILPAFKISRAVIPGDKLIKVTVPGVESRNAGGVKVDTTVDLLFMKNYDDLESKYRFLHVVGASGSLVDNKKWGEVSHNSLISTEFKYIKDAAGSEDVTKLYGGVSKEGWGSIAGISVKPPAPAVATVLMGSDSASQTRVLLQGFNKKGVNTAQSVQVHMFCATENEKNTIDLNMRLRDQMFGLRQREHREKVRKNNIKTEKAQFGKITGITIGVLVVGVVVIGVVVYFVRRR
jgi:hypothetical protein